MNYLLNEEKDKIVKEDGKIVANIVDGEIKPTAPVYYKHMDELRKVAFGPTQEDDTSPEQVAEEEGFEVIDNEGESEWESRVRGFEEFEKGTWERLTYEAVMKVKKIDDWGDDPEPEMSGKWGWKTPGYISWLYRTDPEKASKLYEGKGLPEYEIAKSL
jgi:hypothetical protein